MYRDTILVSAQNAAGSPARVPVELVVHPCPLVPIAADVSLSDSLTTRSCMSPHRPGSFARLYQFSANAGDSISVVMSSAAVDADLVLDGAMAATEPLAESSGCGTARDACLRYQLLPAAGAYTIDATSAEAEQTGIYKLTLTRPHPPGPPDSLAQLISDSLTPLPTGGSTDEPTVAW